MIYRRQRYAQQIGLGIAGALIGGAIIGAGTQPYGYYGYPITGAGCCARRATGQAAEAHTSFKNFRRRMPVPQSECGSVAV